MVRFADTGIGINKKIKDKIYEPFFTTKNGKGTGLGLYVVSLVAKNHGGRIDMFSEVGKGSRFELSFPINTET